MTKLSVIVISKNAQGSIRACLESVKWADEIVVVDDLSADDTVKIAGEYTDKIFAKKMEDFGRQYQYAVERASGEWILVLDTDEVVTSFLGEEIRQAVKSERYDAYRIYRKNNYLGKWMRYCGWYVPILRLFRKEKGRFNSAMVHGEVIVNESAGLLKGEILHHTYRNISHQADKMNLFSYYGAMELKRRGVSLRWYSYPWYFAAKPALYFLKKYIWLQGFREGIHGLVLSCFAAAGVFINYAKLWENEKNDRS